MDINESITNNEISYKCSIAYALDIIGGKWKPLMLWHLRNGALMFGELQCILSGISQKVLTEHLRELENDGLINRQIYTQVPLKVEYSLIEQGGTVLPILEKISDWGKYYCAYKRETI